MTLVIQLFNNNALSTKNTNFKVTNNIQLGSTEVRTWIAVF